ncbi:hypothetical protein MMC20_000690 [Loxospora ochrophaea]|nr:hypothetical protein [Loxospora ochrophaea]
MTRKVYAQTSSNKPDAFVLKLLREEAKAAQAPYSLPLRPGKAEKVLGRRHGFSSFFCGLWEYDKSALVFRPYYQQLTGGTVQFTKNSFVLESGANHLEVLYSAIYSVTTGTIGDFSLTVTLLEAPRTYEKIDGATSVAASRANGPQQPKWARVSSVNPDHDSVFSSCMVYRILFRDAALAVSSTLKKVDGLPPATLWPTRVLMPKNPFAKRLSQISEALATRYDNIPFVLKFQMQRLVQSGFLSPLRVLELLPELSAMVSRSSLAICLGALRRLFSQIPFPGPESEAEDLGLDALVKLIRMNEASTRRETQFIKDKPNQNRALILKAMVTPVGIYLDGPELDPMNRVLRLYSDFLDYFLKVTFAEEDGEALRFSRKVTNEYIFESRFKKVLDGVINVAGRGFEFLGFSHSSLRTRSCWFMAPFTWKGELLHARLVIKRLGDFSGIRSPAKCAARIGQAFSDTSVAITVPSGCFKEIQDIERNGRVFSDGVGVISSSIQHRICQKYALSSGLKPTLYQIRYRGMSEIFVDNRSQGGVG